MPSSDSAAPQQRFSRRTPAGDTHARLVCDDCGFIHYENPKIVVGAVASWDDKILLCRRSISPRKGFWTLPAGFLELGETALEGVRREAWEEARATIEIDQLLAVYSIPRISQIQLIYRARLANPDVEAGEETAETALFAWHDLPWPDLAFPSVRWALNHYREVEHQVSFAPRNNPAGELGDYTP